MRTVEKWEQQANLTRESRQSKRTLKESLYELETKEDPFEDSRNTAKKQQAAPVVERLNALEKRVSDLKQDKKQPKFHDGEESRFKRKDAHQFSNSPQRQHFSGNEQGTTGNCYACNLPGHRFLQCRLASS